MMKERILPAVLLAVLGAVLIGFVRAWTLFVPGIFGMAAGGVGGWLAGRFARRRASDSSVFSDRLGLSLGAGTLYGVISAVTVSVLSAGVFEAPLAWLSGVLKGLRHEWFFGISRGSLQTVGGGLDGGWWVFFVVLDAALFAFLFLVGLGAGEFPSPDDEGEENDGDTEDEDFPGEPVAPGRGSRAFVPCVVLAILALLLPSWWSAPGTPRRGPSAASLAGSWRMEPSKLFGNDPDGSVSFRILTGLRNDLMVMTEDGDRFSMLLSPRRDGVWEGTMIVGGRRLLPVRMHPDGKDALRFAVDRDTPFGTEELLLSATRRTD